MIKFESKFMMKIISKLIQRVIKKKIGCLLEVNLNDLDLSEKGDSIHLHLDVDTRIKKEDFEKIVLEQGEER